MLDFFKGLLGDNKETFRENPINIGKNEKVYNFMSTLRKKDGSLDHRGHSGNDRTPSQKNGDRTRRK